VAAVAMIATEFSTIASVNVKGGPPCEDVANSAAAQQCVKTGGDQHSYALILLGLGALAMGLGAALGRSRPAAGALVGIGVLVLAIAMLGDLPDTRETGLIGAAYEAEAKSGAGLIYEVVGAGLAIVAGVVALTRRD
jgi:LPXTG-motif cell wall-anchored protein